MAGETFLFDWDGLGRPPNRNMEQNIDNILAEVLTEQPYIVEIDDKYIAFPPMSLGQSLLVAKIAKRLGINYATATLSPIAEMMRVVGEERDCACRYLAMRSFHAKNKLLNEREIEERMRLFASLEDADLAQLLLVLMTDGDKEQTIIRHYGIDKEQEMMARASSAKKDSNSLNFGGRSIYGAMIDRACERYGWTVEYVVWGISLANLNLLLADMTTSIYLSDEELKKARLPKDKEVINGDDPSNKGKLKALLKG